MCQVGINVRMSWQALRSLPSHPSSHTNTLLPCLEHMVHQQRHLAVLTPGSCASSSPVGSLGTATSSTTCGSSWVKRRAMNYFEAAAANLTFIQEIHYKHMTASQSTCHPHTNTRLTTWLVSCAKGLCVSSYDCMVHLRWKTADALWWISACCSLSTSSTSAFQKGPGRQTSGSSWPTKGVFFLNPQIYKSEKKKNISGSKIMRFGLHLAASANLFVLGRMESKVSQGLYWKKFPFHFHNEQMDVWPFNSAIIASHSISNGGFDNQGHLPEALWIHLSGDTMDCW